MSFVDFIHRSSSGIGTTGRGGKHTGEGGGKKGGGSVAGSGSHGGTPGVPFDVSRTDETMRPAFSAVDSARQYVAPAMAGLSMFRMPIFFASPVTAFGFRI
jgi:hypothetical protein